MKKFIDNQLINSIVLDLKSRRSFDITQNHSMKESLHHLTQLHASDCPGMQIYGVQTGDCTILAYFSGNNQLMKTAVVTY